MIIDWYDLLRLIAAIAGGAIIGLERELHDKPAGFRTNILICLGAALFTLLSVRLAEFGTLVDRSRIAAQVVTGVGFLGAGAIIQFRGNVIGLTTAATIWTVASVGMAFGAGFFALGAASTVLATAVLLALGVAENYIARWRTTAHIQIVMAPSLEVVAAVEKRIRKRGVYRRAWTIEKNADGLTVHASLMGPTDTLEELLHELVAEPDVRSLNRL